MMKSLIVVRKRFMGYPNLALIEASNPSWVNGFSRKIKAGSISNIVLYERGEKLLAIMMGMPAYDGSDFNCLRKASPVISSSNKSRMMRSGLSSFIFSNACFPSRARLTI